MSEVPKSDTGIHATADATNPFAPIDYTSRLKAPSRHTGTFHAMQPLQPGQLYGTAHWMSPPKPLSPRPLPQKSEELPPAQGFPSFSAPFPPYEDRSQAEPAPENVPATPRYSALSEKAARSRPHRHTRSTAVRSHRGAMQRHGFSSAASGSRSRFGVGGSA